MEDDRYDVWSCARCGTTRELPSLPLQSPQCCGTGMWFVKLKVGPRYEWQKEQQRSRMRDV